MLEKRLAAIGEETGEALNRHVARALAHYAPRCVGFYWPLKGEIDLRATLGQWLDEASEREAALPVIGEPGTALVFHAWRPQMPMRIGRHRIPEPSSGAVRVPQLLLIPCVGFDEAGYRLGYGGGYYDRTLANWPHDARPVTVGVACEACRVAQLPREAHDVPLDGIATESGFHLRRP